VYSTGAAWAADHPAATEKQTPSKPDFIIVHLRRLEPRPMHCITQCMRR